MEQQAITNENIQGNINKYYFYQFFNSLEFFAPIIVIFWQTRGLNMTQVMLLQTIYALAVVLLELPTGAFADYFGKKLALVLGSLFYALGLFIYGISFNFWQFVLGEITVGTGMAFISGADRAFIHETLKSLSQEKEYKKIEGKTRALTQIARTAANFIGGFIGSISLGLTLIASGAFNFVSFLIGFSFCETKEKLPREEKTKYIQIIKESLWVVKDNKKVLWFVLFFAVFNSFVWNVNWFSQPYLQMLNVPVVYFGAIFAGFHIVYAIGSSLVGQFEKITREKVFLVISLITVIIMFSIGKFPSLFIFPFWSLFGTFVLINQTLVSDKVLNLIPANRAATILSFMNLLRRFIYAVTGPFLGKISDLFGVSIALQFNSLALFLILGSLLVIRPKFTKK